MAEFEIKKPTKGRNTIIGKHSLLIVVSDETEIASQLFNYDDVKEIRVSLKDLEVQVLMNYDDSYYRVFKHPLPLKDSSPETRQKAEQVVLKFYNDLVNASMKFTKEELENIVKQQQANLKKFQEAQQAEQEKLAKKN